MDKMCLNLKESKFNNINEVEQLLNMNVTETEIIAIKDNRELIENELKLARSKKEVYDLYL